jgi:hypothetical protein
MTPFSTDKVSLGRPAICGRPGVSWVRVFCMSKSAWDMSYSQPHALAVDFLYCTFWMWWAGDSVGKDAFPRILASLLLLGWLL